MEKIKQKINHTFKNRFEFNHEFLVKYTRNIVVKQRDFNKKKSNACSLLIGNYSMSEKEWHYIIEYLYGCMYYVYIISRTNLLSLMGRVCVLLTRNQFKLHRFLRV